MKKVSFTSGSLTIQGTLTTPTDQIPAPGVIIFHGMTSSADSYSHLSTILAEHGIAALAISMRGHGTSDGDFDQSTVAEAISDAVAAYDFLVAQPGIDAGRIGVCGSSVGAILAAMLTAKRPVRSAVLRAPAAYTDEMMQLSMAGTMVNEARQFHEITDLTTTPAGQAIQQFTGSLFVIASQHDAIIPLSVSKGYVDAARHASQTRLMVIEGAVHTLTGALKETFCRAVLDWFVEAL